MINKYFITSVFVILSLCLFLNHGFASREMPRKVPPIRYNNIEYRVPYGNANKMGYVEAWDIKNSKKLWEKEIYNVNINHKFEEDAQWVFIDSMKLENGNLLITNEHNEIYILDLKTKKVLKEQSKTNTNKVNWWEFWK